MLCDVFILYSSSLLIFIRIIVFSNCFGESHLCAADYSRRKKVIKKNSTTPYKELDENSSSLDITDSKFNTNILISPILNPVVYVQINVDPEKAVNFSTDKKLEEINGKNSNYFSSLAGLLPNTSISDFYHLIQSNVKGTTANEIRSTIRNYLETLARSQNNINNNVTNPNNYILLKRDNEFDKLLKRNNSKSLAKSKIRRNEKSSHITSELFHRNNINHFLNDKTNKKINRQLPQCSTNKNESNSSLLSNERGDSSITQLLVKAFGPEHYDESGISSYNVYSVINNRTKIKSNGNLNYGTNVKDTEEQFCNRNDIMKELTNERPHKDNIDLKNSKKELDDSLARFINNRIQLEGLSEIKNKNNDKKQQFNLAKEIIDNNEMLNRFTNKNKLRRERIENYNVYSDNFLKRNTSKFKRSNNRNGNNYNEGLDNKDDEDDDDDDDLSFKKDKVKKKFRFHRKQKDQTKEFKNSEIGNASLTESVKEIRNNQLLPMIHEVNFNSNLIGRFTNQDRDEENYKPDNNYKRKYYEGESSNQSLLEITRSDALIGFPLNDGPKRMKHKTFNHHTMLVKQTNDKYIQNNKMEANNQDGNYDDSDEYDSWAGDKKRTNIVVANKEKAHTVCFEHQYNNVTTRIIELINSKMGLVQKSGFNDLKMALLTKNVEDTTEKFNKIMNWPTLSDVKNPENVSVNNKKVIKNKGNEDGKWDHCHRGESDSQKVKYTSLVSSKRKKIFPLKATFKAVSKLHRTTVEDGINSIIYCSDNSSSQPLITKTIDYSKVNELTKRRKDKMSKTKINRRHKRKHSTKYNNRGYMSFTETLACQ